MAKKTETKQEIHMERQSVFLAERVAETESQLSALDGELVAIDQQHATLAGAVEIDPGAVQSLLTRRQMILGEQTTLQLRVGSLRAQQKGAEVEEGIQRLNAIEGEQVRLAGKADVICREFRDLKGDM